MTMNSVPRNAVNNNNNSARSARFFASRAITLEEFLSSLEEADTYHLQIEQCLIDHPVVTAGMNLTLAAFKSLGSHLGHVFMSPRTEALLRKMTGHKSETIRKHVSALTYLTMLLPYTFVDGKQIIIHAGPHKPVQDKAHEHLAGEMTKDRAERDKLAKALAKDRDKKAAARAKRAAMKQAMKQANSQAGTETPDPPFSGADPGTDKPNSGHADAEETAPKSQNSGTGVPSPQMGVPPSYTTGDITGDTNVDNTTTPTSAGPSVVGESRAREDAAQDVPVVVFAKSDGGEERESEQEQSAKKSLKEEQDDLMLDDPFDDDDLPPSKASAPKASAPSVKPVPGEEDAARQMMLVTARLETEIGMEVTATERLVAKFREAGDSDADIAEVLGKALTATLKKKRDTKVGNPAGFFTNTASNMAAARRLENTSTQCAEQERQTRKEEALRASAEGDDLNALFARYKALYASDKPAFAAVGKAAQRMACESVPGWMGMGIDQRREALSPYMLRAFKLYEAREEIA